MKTYLRFKGYNTLTLDLLGAPYNILISVTGNLAKKISQRVSKAGVKIGRNARDQEAGKELQERV
jgi:hypothetical protein